MLKDPDKILYTIMSYLGEAGGQPSGASSICLYLKDKGFILSEASVGRLLRTLDHDGYTDKYGKRGRLLSDRGRQRLKELEETMWQHEWTGNFMDVHTDIDKDYLLQLIDARLPVETAVARLAAQNATPMQIEELQAIVDEQEKQAKAGAPVSTLDTEFHLTLAAASHNQILGAIVELLRKKEELTRAMEYVRRSGGQIYNMEHRKILEAIEAKDPDLAELTMKRHIMNLKNAIPR